MTSISFFGSRFRFLIAILFCVVACQATVDAQDLFLQDQLGDLGGFEMVDDPVKLTGDFQLKTGTRLGVLNVRAEIAENWHLYSITQPRGGPIRSEIKVESGDAFEVVGGFKPDAAPHVTEEVEGFEVPVEDHEYGVVWSAPIQISENADPAQLKIKMIFNGQTCVTLPSGETGTCKLLRNIEIEASFAGFDETLKVAEPAAEVKIEKFRPPMSHVDFSGQVVRADGTREVIKPGDKITFELTAEPEGDYHVYSYEPKKTAEAQSTLVAFTENNGWNIKLPRVSAKPEKEETLGYLYHHDPVTWSFEISIPEDVEEKNYSLDGMVGFQTCTHSGCDPPGGMKFSVVIPVGTATGPIPVKFQTGAKYNDVLKAVEGEIQKQIEQAEATTANQASVDKTRHFDTPEEIAEMATYYDPDEKIKYLTLSELEENPVGANPTNLVRRPKTTLWGALVGAFLGGILLNLMPCVFPVLGLKVMGFVEQAGSDPKKIRMHGIAFTMGLVASMWVLAGAILTVKLAWGQDVNWGAQMGNPYFVVFIIVLLFLLGLNMAGVFEIGTSLTRVGGGVPAKKGYSSSFLSGILTTLIATPCSGPFLGAAMGYTLAQPAGTAMFLFTVFALGIAFPYIVLSFFPSLINKMPKPGAWMHTFKVSMAFALFATVAFFMQTFGGQTGVDGLSWLVMALVVLGLAAFFYGTWSPAYVKPFKRRVFGFVVPGMIAAAGVWMCYDAAKLESDGLASHSAGGFTWQTWNPGKVEYMLAKKKKIIWVDYTANW